MYFLKKIIILRYLKKEIKNNLIKTIGVPIYVKLPTPESLLGDKLTAFAPNTIGVKPMMENKNGKIVDKRIETIKQFFDCASLFDVVSNFDEVIESYMNTAISEMKYRGLNLSIQDCLLDTFNAAASIISRGKIDPKGYSDYLSGIKGIGSFLINVNFNAETARIPSAKIMYLTACIISKASFQNEIPDQELIIGDYSKLNFLKKIDKTCFNMAAYAISLIKNSL